MLGRCLKVVGIFVVLSLVAGQPIAITVPELGKRLVARRDSLPEGSIEFQGFVVVMPTAEYDRFRQIVLKAPASGATDQLAASFGREGIDRITAYDGKFFYRNGNAEVWRLIRKRSDAFAHERERAEQEARQRGAVARHGPTSEDIASDGSKVEVLQDNKQLWYRSKATEVEYIRAGNFDISLMDWRPMIEQGAAPGQKIVATDSGNEVSLNFSTEGKPSSATYYFSKELGYAPTRALVESGQRTLCEMLYAYSAESKASATPATPRVSTKADFRPDGKIQVEVFIFREWRDEVKDSDLKIVLPPQYLMIDERLGGRPLMVVRDENGDTHISDPAFTQPSPATSAVSSPNSGSSAGRSGDMPKSIAETPRSLGTILATLVVLALCVSGWAVWRSRHKTIQH